MRSSHILHGLCPAFVLLACLCLLQGTAAAENIPLDHPVTAVITKYLQSRVSQDWDATSSMLLPTWLERKKKETVAIVKQAPTMTQEAALLEQFGAKTIEDLGKLSARELYVAERDIVNKKMKIDPAVKKRIEETLKITILGLAGEDENRVLHATVRTSQETLDSTIEELFLITLVKDKEGKDQWFIVPDAMRPISTPLAKDGAGKADEAKADEATAKPTEPKAEDKPAAGSKKSAGKK